MTEGGPYDAWIDAYERAFAAPAGVGSQRCPGCGAARLRLVFVVARPGADTGHAAFWCEDCLRGVVPCRCPVPEGSTVQTGNAGIPDFAVVAPG